MRLKMRWPSATNARNPPVWACFKRVFKSAPAIKIDFLAEAMIKPRSDESFSIRSTCSFNSLSVAASKIFAPDSGRSKMSRQTLSSPISRRIIELVTAGGMGSYLDRFDANSKCRRTISDFFERALRTTSLNVRNPGGTRPARINFLNLIYEQQTSGPRRGRFQAG